MSELSTNRAGQALDLEAIEALWKEGIVAGAHTACAMAVPGLIARIRELEARTPAPDAVKLVDEFGDSMRRRGEMKYADCVSEPQWTAQVKRCDEAKITLLTALSKPIPAAQPTIGEYLEKLAVALREIARYENPGKGKWKDMGEASRQHWREEANKILALIQSPTLPPNPKGWEPGDHRTSWDYVFQMG